MAEVMDRHHVPRLVEDYSIVPYNDKVFTLCIEAERPIKLNIDYHTKMLLDQIDGNRNLEQVTEEFNSHTTINLSVDDTIEIFNKRIAGFGILEGDNNERIKIKDEYLRLRFQVFPTKVVTMIASQLKFLYVSNVFKYLFPLAFVFLFFSFYFFLDFDDFYDGLDPSLFTTLLLINILGVVIHEFGHAAACLNFGAKNGPIGFGFYFVMPVMYSDVSDAWRLNRKERIIVDLGGIYIQMLFTCLIVLTYFITNNAMYLQIGFCIAIVTAINLSPFLRYDGYWALSDITQISNLQEKSRNCVKGFFRWIIGFNKTWESNRRQWFLLIYGFSRTVILIAFLTYVLMYRSDSILLFPGKLATAFTTLFTDFGSIDFEWVKNTLIQFFIPIMFCIILTKEIIKYLKIRVVK